MDRTGEILASAKRYCELKWAVHWLKPRSKRPLESGWSSSPRKTFSELKETFNPTYNVGVLLGEPSNLGDGLLIGLDLDSRSSDPRHLAEMEAALEQHFPGLKNLRPPEVLSGRGNGSRHIYVRSRFPIKSRKVARSTEMIPVKLATREAPTAEDKKRLSQKMLSEGFRLRRAWEIDVMSTGRQAVLPPSIHPDTGRMYSWKNPIRTLEDIPLFDFPPEKLPDGSVANAAEDLRRPKFLEDFQGMDVAIEGRGLPRVMVKKIKMAEDIVDHSAYLFSASLCMAKRGFTQEEVLSILTDRQKYRLADVPFRHASTSSRTRAAEWLWRYTVARAFREIDPATGFGVVENWRSLLALNKEGEIRSILLNLVTILKNSIKEPAFKLNGFSMREVYGADTPWGGKASEELQDSDAIKLKIWFSQNFKVEPKKELIFELFTFLAAENVFHPVKDYLEALVWDRKKRLGKWMRHCLGAKAPEPYLSQVSEKFICAMVSRVYGPGSKFDYVLVLEGPQGVGKSSVAKILGSPDWYCESVHGDLKHADATLNLQGNWVVEFSELASLKRSDSETIKSFISRSTDRVRAPYGKLARNYPRQFVFVGTTNNSTYLKDETGNRRFWPVPVGKIDLKLLESERDQLFAEAKWLVDNRKVTLYLTPEAESQAREAQEIRVADSVADQMFERLQAFISEQGAWNASERFNFGKFKLHEVFDRIFDRWKPDGWHIQQATQALKRAGFVNRKVSGITIWGNVTSREGGGGGPL